MNKKTLIATGVIAVTFTALIAVKTAALAAILDVEEVKISPSAELQLVSRHEQARAARILEISTAATTNTTAASATSSAAASTSEQLAADEPLSPEALRDLLAAAGFEGKSLKTAWAIAMRESTGKPWAHNQNSSTGDNSYGLFQINMIGKLGPARLDKYNLGSYEELFDPTVNARVAFEMSKGGTDFGPWGLGPNAYNGGKVGDLPRWLTEYPERRN